MRVNSLFFSLAFPAITAQLVNMMYNMVDRVFISRIPLVGNASFAGVGVCLPFSILIGAFASLVGSGGAPLAAIAMGSGDNNRAESILSGSLGLIIAIAVALTSLLYLYAEPLLYLVGAGSETIEYALTYLRIYVAGTIFVMVSLGLNMFISTQGFSSTAMMTVVIGAALNIILDPIFIFAFKMGVKGAALATLISQAVSALWVLRFFIRGKSKLRFKSDHIFPKMHIMLPVLALGVSPFIMSSTEALLSVSLNASMQKYGGNSAVSMMVVMNSVYQLMFLPVVGMSQAAQAIISYNYGAGESDRVRSGFRVFVKSAMIYCGIFWFLIMLFPGFISKIFNPDPEVVKMCVWGMRIYLAFSFLMGAQIACQQSFVAVGQARTSLALALLRKMVLLIPLIFILPRIMDDKLKAVLIAEPVSDLIAVVSTVYVFKLKFFNLVEARADEVKMR